MLIMQGISLGGIGIGLSIALSLTMLFTLSIFWAVRLMLAATRWKCLS